MSEVGFYHLGAHAARARAAAAAGARAGRGSSRRGDGGIGRARGSRSTRCCGPTTRRASCRTAPRATAPRRASRSSSPPPTRIPTHATMLVLVDGAASAASRRASAASAIMFDGNDDGRGRRGARALARGQGRRPRSRLLAADRHRLGTGRRRHRLMPACAAAITAAVSREGEAASMALERTLSIIKPDATRRNLTGLINARLRGARVAHRRPKAPAPHARPGRGSSMPCTARGRSSPASSRSCRRARSWPRCSRARMRSRATARPWARPIRPRPRPARSARISPKTSRRIRSTAPIRRDTAAEEIAFFFSGLELCP